MRKLGRDSIGRSGGKETRRTNQIFAELFQSLTFVARTPLALRFQANLDELEHLIGQMTLSTLWVVAFCRSEARPDFPRKPRCRYERLRHLQGDCRGKNQPDVFRVVGIKQHRATQLNPTRSFLIGKKGAEGCVLVEGVYEGNLTIGVIESIEDIGAGMQPVESLAVGVLFLRISPNALRKIFGPSSEASFVP